MVMLGIECGSNFGLMNRHKNASLAALFVVESDDLFAPGNNIQVT